MERGLKRREFVSRAAGLVFAPLAFSGCAGGKSVRLAGVSMGTTWQAILPATTSPEAAFRAGIEELLASVDRRMSGWRSDSEISRFNSAETLDWFPVSTETASVVAESLRIARLTGGAFDVTVGAAVRLWGFGPAPSARHPAAAQLAKLRGKTGYRKIVARRDAIRRLGPGVAIDLSGIAKGHAADRVSALFEQMGETDYLFEIGGELRCRGRNESGQRWSVAIERPEAGRRTPLGLLRLRRGGIATSGDYRRFLVRKGRRDGHIIDPRTLRPVSHGTASVTVHADTAAAADALATGLFVLGAAEGLKLASRHGIAVLYLVRRGAEFVVRASTEFRRRRLMEDVSKWNIS